MVRTEAYETLTSLIKNRNLIKHCLACEAIMIALCLKLNPGADEVLVSKWATVGLLHDGDYEITSDTPGKHGIVIAEKLKDRLEDDEAQAIKAHNWLRNGVEPQSLMDWAIYCCDELSGIIVAAALVHPDKRLASLDVPFIMNRLSDASFAKGANREQIKMCEAKLGIPLPEFVGICLSAMQTISEDLNL